MRGWLEHIFAHPWVCPVTLVISLASRRLQEITHSGFKLSPFSRSITSTLTCHIVGAAAGNSSLTRFKLSHTLSEEESSETTRTTTVSRTRGSLLNYRPTFSLSLSSHSTRGRRTNRECGAVECFCLVTSLESFQINSTIRAITMS